MNKNRLLTLSATLALVGWALFFISDHFYLYWSYWWWDVLMHFYVSMTGAFGLYWGLFHSGIIFRKPFQSEFINIALVFLLVMIIGSGWEVYEYYYGISLDAAEGQVRDTVNDLILDSAGALLAAAFAGRKRHSSNSSL